jgi:hypothetical protein
MGNPLGLQGPAPYVDDGTSARMAAFAPVPLGTRVSTLALDHFRRVRYVEEAWSRLIASYAREAIARQVGEDAWVVFEGAIEGILLAIGGIVLSVAIGAMLGGGAGALAGGVGAVPGALAGAELGLAIGNAILAWVGLGFLAAFVGSHLSEMGAKFGSGISMAWNSEGDRLTIDAAARTLAEGCGIFVSLLIQALVVFLTKRASSQGTAGALAQLRESLLLKRCPRLEPWLIKNFPKLRAKFVPLKWTVLDDKAPLIPGTSVPEWIKIKVGERVFEVFRNKEKIGPDGNPIGPAMKHPGERAQQTASRPILEQALREFKDGLSPDEAKKIEAPQDWPKSEWSKATQTDIPMSWLAAVLDQAEAQLIFKSPDTRAKPMGIPHWELIIDTTRPVWRVFHAEYTAHPRW